MNSEQPPVVFWTSAFRDSDCCGGAFYRSHFTDGEPEQFICRVCWKTCAPVDSERSGETPDMPKPTSKAQARLFGAVAGGRSTKAKGMTRKAAKASLRGRRLKKLPARKRR